MKTFLDILAALVLVAIATTFVGWVIGGLLVASINPRTIVAAFLVVATVLAFVWALARIGGDA